MAIPDVLADNSGFGPPVDASFQAPPPGLPVPSDFSTVNRYNIMQQAMNQTPVVSETPGAATDEPGGVPTNMWGRVGLALMLGGAGLRGDVLPAISVMQQLEQRRTQAALIAEKKRQQEEQKRQHDTGIVEHVMNSNLPSAAKFNALDKLRSEIPWAGTMADGLKDAHLQNFQALKTYIPPDVVDRVTKGQSSAGEISAWADYAQEAYKVDVKEKVRGQVYDAAVNTPADQRSPSQTKLIEERQADLALKQAETGFKLAQTEQAQAKQPKVANKELDDFMSDLGSAGIMPQSKEGQALLKIRAERKAKGTPLVNLDMGQDANKAAQKQFMEKASETYQQLKTAPVQLKNLEKAKALVRDARGFMGPFGTMKLDIAKFLNNNLGMSVDVEGVKNAEELRTRIFQNILENLKKMDAQPSTYQQIVMEKSFGNLDTDPTALARMLDAYAEQISGRVGLYNHEVSSAEQRGVKFPYDPIIKLETTPAAPKPKDINAKFKKLGELLK